jgi:ribosomal protein S19E (S16A)
MSMAKKRKFVDGVESISFMEGMVHLELFNYIAGSQKEKGKRPELEITEELIFTPQGFLRAFSAMQNLVNQLEQAGVVRKNENAASPVEAEVVEEGSVNKTSPNWNNN